MRGVVGLVMLLRAERRLQPVVFQDLDGIDMAAPVQSASVALDLDADLAAALPVAGVGRVQLWVASTRQHGICSALRLPNGAWAGLGTSRVDEGGSVPGCHPTRQQINQAGGPVYAIDGFDYEEALVRGHDGRSWRLEYGTITPPHGHASHVRDALSGITAPAADARWFAIVLPHPTPASHAPLAPAGARRHRQRDRRRADHHVASTGPSTPPGPGVSAVSRTSLPVVRDCSE